MSKVKEWKISKIYIFEVHFAEELQQAIDSIGEINNVDEVARVDIE